MSDLTVFRQVLAWAHACVAVLGSVQESPLTQEELAALRLLEDLEADPIGVLRALVEHDYAEEVAQLILERDAWKDHAEVLGACREEMERLYGVPRDIIEKC